LGSVLVLTFLQSGVSVVFSYLSRDFWTALSTKNVDLFQLKSLQFFGMLAIGTPIFVLNGYIRDLVSVRWRAWLTKHTMEAYMRNKNYYQIEASKSVDNPDQRLAEDLRSFTRSSLSFALSILMSILDLVSFSAILFSIYPSLFIVLIAYATVGTAVTTVIGKRLIPLNFAQLQKEADFRYSLVRLRENAESVAFYQGEKQEKDAVEGRLDFAIGNYIDLIRWQRNLDFFTTAYRYLIQVLPALVVAPIYFKGGMELGVVSQSFSAFNHILNDLSIIVNQFEELSKFSAGIDRLGEFVEVIESDGFDFSNSKQAALQIEEAEHDVAALRPVVEPTHVHYAGIEVAEDESKVLEIKNLTLVTPGTQRVLISDLNFDMASRGLLIVGPSGSGKSSLLRAIAGLWSTGSGSIERAQLADTFFIPQRPYCSLGTLREQLMYPRTEVVLDDAALHAALHSVDLAALPSRVGGFDEVRDWSNMLSLGEQQRLAFARLVITRPRVAILDESSSALDLKSEANLYSFLRKSGIVYISVGHRPSLVEYHETILRLGDNASWSVEEIGPGSELR